MVYIIRHTFNSIFTTVRSSVIFKAYFCDKKDILLKTLNELTEEKTSNSGQSEKTREEIENYLLENEEKVMQTVILEKEKDANVRSRLSKECNNLLDGKISLTSTGLNLHLDQNTVNNNTCWEDYLFDTTVDNAKKRNPGPCANIQRVNKPICQKDKPVKNGSGNKPPTESSRITRGEPGQVLFAFIPIEWFHFFIPKTGVSGFGTFLFTFGTFLVSKEYYVLEHNFYNGLGVAGVVWGTLKYVGPHLAKYLDKEIENYEMLWQKGRDDTREVLEQQIEHEKLLQLQAEGQHLLIAAKRENVQLQLEEEFRIRQMTVYHEVLRRLNYQIAVGAVYKRIYHRNLVEYVMREVKKSISPEMEKEMFNVSISSLVAELQARGNKA